MKQLGNTDKQHVGRWANIGVENRHYLPTKGEAMLWFPQMKTLQKFASLDANVHNHCNQKRDFIDRQTCKTRRSAALAKYKPSGAKPIMLPFEIR